ncbi:archaeal conserved hypothetical protein (DUF2144) [Thermoplasmatales archaeon BRNA1]|nr:archaeal conserved hypothetical protein (DUF2144) [Thermoplasmatales archaeon BRNA1]
MPTAVLRLASDTSGAAVSALEPEVRRDLPRTKSRIYTEEGDAVLEIEAADTTSMRAAVNSFLECITITEDIDRITKESK